MGEAGQQRLQLAHILHILPAEIQLAVGGAERGAVEGDAPSHIHAVQAVPEPAQLLVGEAAAGEIHAAQPGEARQRFAQLPEGEALAAGEGDLLSVVGKPAAADRLHLVVQIYPGVLFPQRRGLLFAQRGGDDAEGAQGGEVGEIFHELGKVRVRGGQRQLLRLCGDAPAAQRDAAEHPALGVKKLKLVEGGDVPAAPPVHLLQTGEEGEGGEVLFGEGGGGDGETAAVETLRPNGHLPEELTVREALCETQHFPGAEEAAPEVDAPGIPQQPQPPVAAHGEIPQIQLPAVPRHRPAADERPGGGEGEGEDERAEQQREQQGRCALIQPAKYLFPHLRPSFFLFCLF